MDNIKPFPHISKDVKLASEVIFIGDIYVRDKCEFGANVVIDASNYRITIGTGCKIEDNSTIISENSPIEIGVNVKIGKNCAIQSSLQDNEIIADQSIINFNEISPDNQI